MKTQIASYQLAWLLEPAEQKSLIPGTNGDVERLTYGLPSELGEAWVESLQLASGMTLFHAVHVLDKAPGGQLVPLIEVDLSPPEPIFCAQVFLGGICCHAERWPQSDKPVINVISGPGRDIFRHHKNWHATVLVEGGVTSEMNSIVIQEPVLNDLMGAAAAELIDSLGLSVNAPSVVRSMPAHLSTPLREAMSAQFFGPARKLYAQARALDYLAGLLKHVKGDSAMPKERRHRARIRDLHEYLMQLDGRLPTLSELAKDFGLSARQLNMEFSTEYGQSVFAFVTAHRLEQAHVALQQTALPMKTIAGRLGYSHVNHFITAFRRKFGYPPGSLRRDKGAAAAVALRKPVNRSTV